MNSNKNKAQGHGGENATGSFWNKVKDVAAKTQTASKNTKETISIQKKQLMISERKKNFGIEYLDLLEGGATPQELQECVDRALEAVATMKGKVAKYKDRIAINDAKLDSKLSTTPNYTEPTINITQTNSSSASEEEEQRPPPTAPYYDTTAHPAPSAPFASDGSPSYHVNNTNTTGTSSSSNPFDDDILEENNNIRSTPTTQSAATAHTVRNRSTNPFGDVDDDDEPQISVQPPAPAPTPTPPAAAASAIPVQNGSTNPFEDDTAVDVPMAQAKIF